MKKVFVDTENISNYSKLEELELTKRDEIVLFLTKNSKPLKAETLILIHSFGCKISTLMFEPTGQNALDFHIVTHLGLKYSKKNEYYIFSNDKGYEASKNHFNSLGYYNVHLVHEINNTNDKQKNNQKKYSFDLKIIGNQLQIDELELRRIFKNHRDKLDFHNSLVSNFGEKGKIMYQDYKKKYMYY